MKDDAKLRILVLNWLDRENPQAGGAEEHLHQIFGRLASRGHEVTLLASGFAGCAPTAELDGIEVHRTGARYTFSLAAPAYYMRRLRRRTFDVVVEDLNKVPLFTPGWVRAPVLLLVHHLFGKTAFQEAWWPLAAATWLLERPVPQVFSGKPTIAVSESTKADLLERGLRSPIEVIPNGIDLGRFTPDPENRRTPTPSLLYLGRVKRYKRVDLLIRAVARLRDEGVHVDFRIAGTGDARHALEALVQELDIADRVEFLGFVDEDHKLELLRSSWIHGLTSPKEGWGISNLEAAACGTPTVASDSPGLRESVLDGRTGLLVPHEDVAALASAVRRLVEDHETREEMQAAASVFAQGYSWDASTDATEAALLRVVADGRPE